MNQACKDAKNARRRALRASDPMRRAKEAALAKRRSWSQRMLYNCKNRSKYLGIPFDLTRNDLVIPDTCPILGIPLQSCPQGRPGPNTPSVDRVIPKLGYVRGNIAVISFRANRIKNDATYQELRAVTDWLGAKVIKQ